MRLDDLLAGDETFVYEWLIERSLVHECDCGYTVYDPDDVSAEVQAEWGDNRCDEIYCWSCDLSNKFGWMFLESSSPEHDIFHCQYCSESEWSMLMDMEKIAHSNESSEPLDDDLLQKITCILPPKENFIAYIDESYTNGFPRHHGGAFVYSAFIIPESKVDILESEMQRILRSNYRGSAPNEIKYSKISKSKRKLENIGRELANLINSIPDCAVLGLFVPQEGLFEEKHRTIKAVAHYDHREVDQTEVTKITSEKSIEKAVSEAPDILAQTMANCIAQYIIANGAKGIIYFDPRSEKQNKILYDHLINLLPITPTNIPQLKHSDAIVLPHLHENIERLGERIICKFNKNSVECFGLQMADFLAGDIRTFFEETPDLLSLNTSSGLLFNKRIIFPQAFKISKVKIEIQEKFKNRNGASFVPAYHNKLANGLISYYTKNGQMRHLNVKSWEIFDIMD